MTATYEDSLPAPAEFPQMVAAVDHMLRGGPALWLASGGAKAVPAGTGAVVETSGSSGNARRVLLPRDALLAAADAARDRLGADLTWHLSLSPRYVAGLMVIVRSLLGGREPIRCASDLLDLKATGTGDAISLVPTQLRRALGRPDTSAELARFDAVLVGGAALADELRRKAQRHGLRIIRTYGMSETCGGCVWDGQPLPGVSVECVPDPRIPDGSGLIVLGGNMLFDGYLHDDEATSAALREGKFHTSDFGRFSDGRLVVQGRVDEIVISGGVNIDLAEVRNAVLSRDPNAAVLAVPDAEWGTRIVVFAGEGDLPSWRESLAEDLPRTALPRQFVHTPELPRTSGGKPDRGALMALVQQ